MERAKLSDMSYDEILLLVEYNHWARDRALEAVSAISGEQFLRPMGNSFGSIRDTVAHICAAERVWIARLKDEPTEGLAGPERMPDAAAARREWTELEAEMRAAIARLGPEGMERRIDYNDLRGNPQSDPVWQIVQHVVNHGTYHRGQITTMLRQMDAAPAASMDMIAFFRERNRTA